MNKVNELVVCKDNYKNKEEFYKALQDALMVILNNEYECVVRYDEPEFGIIVFEYDYDRNKGYGNALPYWLTPTEAESVIWDDERDDDGIIN